jgi:beta-glucosidase
MGRQCGGWTIEWQGKEGDITPGTTLLQAVRQTVSAATEVLYDADGSFAGGVHAASALVVLSEAPYAEGEGDRMHLALPPEDVALVHRMRARCDRLIVVLYSGRPLLIDDILDQCDALVAAWLPGTEAAGITDVLFGDYPFTGTLPYAWPRAASAQQPQAASPDDRISRADLSHG